MKRFIFLLLPILFACKGVTPTSTQPSSSPRSTTSFSSIVEKLEKFDGYFPFYWDETNGKIWLEINKWDTEFLYQTSLPEGLGSNDIGLDRGRLGNTRVVKFVRRGKKVFLIESNYDYRAITENQSEAQAVEEAFAKSTLWGFDIAEEKDWNAIVDATSFFMQDSYGVRSVLNQTKQGSYTVDVSKSSFNIDRTKNFPLNSEFDVYLTFKGEPKGREIRSVSPNPRLISLSQHHSFIELPDDNYKPRTFDPRSGFIYQSYLDYATPLSEPIRKRHIIRHRLQKKNLSAAMSEPVEPIIYYLDPGVPEPVRSALLDGASWWNEAFEAAGFIDAFRVEILPEDADPMDVRYNVIQWVHRSTRGWSYGYSISDPRTGEIIKGHVSLGSLRVRQDMLIAQGLLSPYKEGGREDEVEKMALARLRQLSAHEVGHTIGLVHNYASSINDRASVMDYPHPLILIDGEGRLDFSKAYDDKIGAWDKIAINYGYSEVPENQEEKEYLDQIIVQSINDGYRFITDKDARPIGGAHAYAHLWDNGEDPAIELDRVMKVRKIALDGFGKSSIPQGIPFSSLEESLVPVYFFHRYQVEAACKMVGGLDYNYSLNGDDQMIQKILDPSDQKRALNSILATLSPENLTLPEELIALIPPRAHGYSRDRELVKIKTELTFDPLSAAESYADHTLGMLIHPARMSRLVIHNAQDEKYPSVAEVLAEITRNTWKSKHTGGLAGETQRVVDQVYLKQLFSLTSDENASHQVRALAYKEISDLGNWISIQIKIEKSNDQMAHLILAKKMIENFVENPLKFTSTQSKKLPDGSPIGYFELELYCNFH